MSRTCAYCGYANPDFLVDRCLDCNKSLASATQTVKPPGNQEADRTIPGAAELPMVVLPPPLKLEGRSLSVEAAVAQTRIGAATVETRPGPQPSGAITARPSAASVSRLKQLETALRVTLFVLVFLSICLYGGGKEVQERYPETANTTGNSLHIAREARIPSTAPPHSPGALIGIAACTLLSGLVAFLAVKKQGTLEAGILAATITAILALVIAAALTNLFGNFWILFIKMLLGPHGQSS